tara:strand:- start:100 stop:513 length:414 start_codon:yes stop_codon:yes gene_type:complete
MNWQDILKVNTKDAISDARRFGNIDDELNTPNPEMVKVVRFISDFLLKQGLEGFQKLEEQAQYGNTTEGKKKWEDMDMRVSPPAIWFDDSPLNRIINTSAKSKSYFDMKVKLQNAVKKKFGGWLAPDEGYLVTYRKW